LNSNDTSEEKKKDKPEEVDSNLEN